MKTAHANRKERVALQRFAAISFLQQQLREGQTLSDALRRAVLRPWPDERGTYYSSRTLETYWYAFNAGGFAALAPKDREDRGTYRKLPAALGEWVIEQIKAHPAIALKVLYPRWLDAGHCLPSLTTLYRFLRQRGYDARSLRRGRLESGPTKAFEAPFVNDLWMVDFSPGPRLSIDRKSLSTHLCVLLDDHSRLITYAAYYPQADTRALLDALKAAVQRRGLPEKLYTDLGGPFLNHHTAIVCANLGIRLLHAKPYAAWSKGKVERCIHTIQQGFEVTLQLPESRAQSMEDLNQKLSRWIQSVYHLRPHSSTGQTPHERFAAAAARLRQIALGLDLDALFYTRLTRTVRKDGTVRLASRLYEVDLSLRGLQVELRFDPFTLQRIEVYHQGRAHGLARRVDLHLNSQLNSGIHYER
jgi:putative transposase